MNWKRFLHPTWGKVILFVLLPWIADLLAFYLRAFDANSASYYIGILIYPMQSLISYVVSSGAVVIETQAQGVTYSTLFSLMGLINVAYHYLLACFVYSTYKKMKK